MNNELFNFAEFCKWLALGAVCAIFCSIIAFIGLEYTVAYDGHMYSFYSSGMASLTASVVIGNLKMFEFSYLVTPMSVFFNFASIGFYIATHYFASDTSVTFYVYRTFY